MIKFLDLQAVTAMHADEIQVAIHSTVASGWYLQGEAVHRFEAAFATYTHRKHCIGVGNGLDALRLMLRAYIQLGIMQQGDEVIVPANTFIATVLAITDCGLKATLVDADQATLEINDNLIEERITRHTRAIMLVNLYGRSAYTERIGAICQSHGILLLEDCAQSHGVALHGAASAFSFYPGKNLGALGDAGAVVTDDDTLAATIRSIANYGFSRKYVAQYEGLNSRLDEIQAAALSVKLRYLDTDNARRQQIASYYYNNISNQHIQLPQRLPNALNVYHLFPVMCNSRDRLQQYLTDRGIQTLIHYPIPPHHQQAYAGSAQLQLPQSGNLPVTEQLAATELSLPIGPAMTMDETSEVVKAINEYTEQE